MIEAISPIDGRYHRQTQLLQEYFSEFALIRYRVRVEVEYFIALVRQQLPGLKEFPESGFEELRVLYKDFTQEQAARIKDIEKVTNHDVKAVEYFLKEYFDTRGWQVYKEWIHFGLTSQDINNTAIPMSLREAWHSVCEPELLATLGQLEKMAQTWQHVPMLARTHGQPASPTGLGKELTVFTERLAIQLRSLRQVPFCGKFGGATGNFNAHIAAFPGHDWVGFANDFLGKQLGISRTQTTTQIEHYDQLAAFLQALSRIHTILIDLCRDIWTYVSMDYFKQKTVAGEIGSSAMPHKVNPIDFENAEGNLGMANAIAGHLAEKLPVSRLQRDLTDSTVLRNLGLPLAYGLIALRSIRKGLDKLQLNENKLALDLDQNWMILAEAIQSILRREGYEQPYEQLKELTRGKAAVDKAIMHGFIHGLDVSDTVKGELLALTPAGYVGNALAPGGSTVGEILADQAI